MSKHAKFYDDRWRRRRAAWLRANPLCVYCLRRGKSTAATVCDHVQPHRGNRVLFDGPIQSLCESCHNSDKKRQEHGGTMRGCGTDGTPLDPGHHWNMVRTGTENQGGAESQPRAARARPCAQIRALRGIRKFRGS